MSYGVTGILYGISATGIMLYGISATGVFYGISATVVRY